jgi:simple sugar transport system permease protein
MVRTAGERAEVLHAFGTSPRRCASTPSSPAGPCRPGGAQSTSQALNWSENTTAGRGFVAVALVIFAAWNPLMAIGGAYLSAAVALELQMQARGSGLSPSCSTPCPTCS